MGTYTFRLLRLTVLVLAAAGVILSAFLLSMYAGSANSGLAQHVCGGQFDCMHVQQSRWGSIRIGGLAIPQAAVGILYFTVLAVWVGAVGRLPGRLHHSCLVPALMATAGALHSVYMLHVMANKLHVWCPLCVATHGVNFLLVGGLWVLWIGGYKARDAQAEAQEARAMLWKVPALALTAGILLALCLVLFVGMMAGLQYGRLAAGQLEKIENDEQYQRWRFMSGQPAGLAVSPDDPVLGSPDAPHTLVIFADFQCPHCADTDRAVRQVQQALGDAFRMVFKHYPMNLTCNPAMKTPGVHAYACSAAAAVEAARRLGGSEAFWKMHDALFENQTRLAERPYVDLARQLNLDPVAFEQAMGGAAVAERVRQDAELGRQLGVETTPTLFLDGRKVSLNVIYQGKGKGKQVDVPAMTQRWRKLLEWADEAKATPPAAAAVSAES